MQIRVAVKIPFIFTSLNISGSLYLDIFDKEIYRPCILYSRPNPPVIINCLGRNSKANGMGIRPILVWGLTTCVAMGVFRYG